ncbi:sugar ABC transporter ATP-binding protein [Acidisoma cellulosilytica]|uniref:Sugar ABC transporter ATP-binding protein n=1 Tax=Acidisoma cellulosilyticum TaxID=2802395 RepID=A0A963Z526_9PROT|nr:sugar ABC transporter ATP-binding protein [Acidisoma cellulosilyticum]MCB8881933.1 sugar ABC transporter ATP-binding protein [Acidisoma cellulosilyticum]
MSAAAPVMQAPSVQPFLRLDGISKSYPGVRALSNVTLEVMRGEVHALLGENGAGKSTLIKILMGVIQRDEGSMFLDGEAVEVRSPLRAQALGLAAVYQDVTLAQPLTVGENFFLGHLPRKNGMVDWGHMRQETERFLRSLGIMTDARMRVGDLPIAQQQLIAIAKVIWGGAKLIIFDEPTALLTNAETDILFGIIEKLKQEGRCVIYISHRLEEIFRICDSATILKDGGFVRRVQVADVTEDDIMAMMVGRSLDAAFPHRPPTPGDVALDLRGITAAGRLDSVDLTLRRGEILGLYGLIGAGRTELLRVIFGADPMDSGEMRIEGKVVKPNSPLGMIREGVALLTEDRKHQSLALQLDVNVNMNLVVSQNQGRFGLLERKKEDAVTGRFIRALNIRTPSPFQKVLNLSGGNQQKVVIGKWLAADPRIVLFDEPTIGVDVGARVEIYGLIHKLADEGRAIIVVSSYLPEVIGISDRIAVMHKGRIMGIVDKEEATEERLLRLASGLAS